MPATDAGMSYVRNVAKRLFEQCVTRSGLGRVSRALRDARGAVLAYHNVVPTGERVLGERSLHIPQDLFAKHLEAIARTHEVVSLERLLTTESSSGSPRVAITFDDAYRGAVTVGLLETDNYGIPVTVFVAPQLLGRKGFWWDHLADELGTIAPELREAALTDTAGDQGSILKRWAPDGNYQRGEEHGAIPPAYQPCTIEELDRAVIDRDTVTVGSHTWSHRCLPACNRSILKEELERSNHWLRSRYDESYVKCISYPYGRFSKTTVRYARATYRWGLRIDGGLVPRAGTGDSDYVIPRINVPRNMSVRGLLVRLSGLNQSGLLF